MDETAVPVFGSGAGPADAAALAAAGFDPAWLQGELARHGPQLLQLLTDGLNMGLTPAFLHEAVGVLEPVLMDLFLALVGVAGQARLEALEPGAVADTIGGDTARPQPASFVDFIHSPLAVLLVTKLADVLPRLGLSGWKLLLAQFLLRLLSSFVANAPAARQE